MLTIKKVKDLRIDRLPNYIFYFLSNEHIGYSFAKGSSVILNTICNNRGIQYIEHTLYYEIIYSDLIYKDICQFCLDKLHPELIEDIKFHLIIKKLKGQK